MGQYKFKLKRKKQVFYYLLVLIFLIFYISFSLIRSLKKSLFINHQERVNLIFYSASPQFYSLGLVDGVNYQLSFFPDLVLAVPGGYGSYRVGALGKLVELEKNDSLFQKVASYNLGNFSEFYFYKPSNQIFYGHRQRQVIFPSVKDFFTLKTNASFFDKIYLSLFFARNNRTKFARLAVPLLSEKANQEIVFDYNRFYKAHLGYFYEKSYRNENRDVQIIYTKNYQTAKAISEILEGEGIRVVDYTKSDGENIKNRCLVIEKKKNFSKTARAIADFFNCSLKFGETDVSDIIFQLNNLEASWEIN